MKAQPSKHLLSVSLFLLLLLILTACENGTSIPSPSNHNATTTKAPSNNTALSTTPTPVLGSGAQPCPDAISAPAHWAAIIGIPATFARVESVTCAHLMQNPSLQVLVTVRSDGTGGILDVYVYDNITGPRPTQLFKLQDLIEGDARISRYNTIITAEVDAASSVNNGQPDADLVRDLFREFQWSDAAGTFVQVSFPGIFPDLTRFQAEDDQAKVDQGHDSWKLDAALTARTLAVKLLKWPITAATTIVSGGGPLDANAVVNVRGTSPVSSSITVTLSRLEGNTNGGIWEITRVQAGAAASITTPIERDKLSSPVTVTGTGNAFEGQIGTVTVLDHLYTDIGHAVANGAIGNGMSTFSAPVTYHSTFQEGVEEGVVVLYVYGNANGSVAAAVMIKELLGQ
jgi:hypothetical protein